jgi:hypothetical protein
MNAAETLLEAFDVESCAGPDPTRLQGLIELARQRLDGGPSLGRHLNVMLSRVGAARAAREQDYQTCRDRYDVELVELIEDNLQAYRSVERSLLKALEACSQNSSTSLNHAIDQLEVSVLALQDSSNELTDLHACGALICPHCGMPGKDRQCPTCAIDCFYPDPDTNARAGGKLQLPASYGIIFEIYSKVLAGEAFLEELFDALDPVEKALLFAEDMIEQVLADQPEDLKASTIEDLLDDCLEGIAQMRAAEETRQASDLNEGWAALATGSVELYRLLPSLALGTLA